MVKVGFFDEVKGNSTRWCYYNTFYKDVSTLFPTTYHGSLLLSLVFSFSVLCMTGQLEKREDKAFLLCCCKKLVIITDVTLTLTLTLAWDCNIMGEVGITTTTEEKSSSSSSDYSSRQLISLLVFEAIGKHIKVMQRPVTNSAAPSNISLCKSKPMSTQ